MKENKEIKEITPIAVIIGVTGLVGRQLISLLLESGRYQQIYAVVRKRFELSVAEKASFTQVVWLEIPDFSQLRNVISGYDLQNADVFSTLGSTQKQAGSKSAFYQIDHDYNLTFAELTYQQGARHMLLVSAMGADAQSLIFYNRVKGELESDIRSIGFDYFSIFRPSLLLGQREDSRFGERVAQNLFDWGKILLPKNFYASPISGVQVAFAMSQVSALKSLAVLRNPTISSANSQQLSSEHMLSKHLTSERSEEKSIDPHVEIYSNKMMLNIS